MVAETRKKRSRSLSVAGLFLLIFLPLALLVAGVGVGAYLQERAERFKNLKYKEQLQTDFASRSVSRDLLDMTQDLLFLAGMRRTQSISGEGALQLWGNRFKLFSDIKKIYDQIRLLSVTGMELLRVNYHSAGSFEADQNRLQDKSRRYYFSQSIKLNPGRIYISDFDLNLEQERVERPFKPMLRLAAPIFGPDGKPEAVMVLNALGKTLLDHMKKSDIHAPGHIMLLNSRGYWLTGAPVKAYNWAFMFPDSADKNMPGLWPDIWQRINKDLSGQFQTEKGVFTFSRLCPYLLVQSGPGSGESHPAIGRDDWIIVSWVPDAWLEQAGEKSFQRHLAITGGVWVILGFLAFLLARIGQARRQYQEALLAANRSLNQSLKRMRRHNRVGNTINQLSDLVQACASAEEVYKVLADLAPKIFPEYQGELSVVSAGEGLLVASRWGAKGRRPEFFDQGQCWALRRGKIHLTSPTSPQPRCGHLEDNPDKLQLCVPLMAHGVTMGVFSLESLNRAPAADEQEPEDLRLLAANVAEMIALSLSNITLRESLKEQSIRDVLTGLYNRRFMEESLAREEARALRNKVPLGLIMLDVDHFKLFNDNHGHEVGDEVLKNLGAMLKSRSRKEDVACRYGGEEFLLILPGARKRDALARAEDLRKAVQNRLKVKTAAGESLGVTISLGVSSLPEDGESADDALKLADEALLLAKQGGRNRVAGADAPAPVHGK